MTQTLRLQIRRLPAVVIGLLLAGCASPFSAREAHEVSRERLLRISEAGPIDHLHYVGSDASYHYIHDVQTGKERSYKIRADGLKIRDTFPLGEDEYALLPWVIEGTPFGSQTEETPTNAKPGVDDH